MTRKFLVGIDLGGQRAQNASDPSSATDLATKQYVDNTAAGLSWKVNARAASTTNVTVASALTNGSVIDGVTLATGDRVLLKNQTAAAENGVYIVVASGAASRSSDLNTAALVKNAILRVSEGTVAADTMWQMVTDGTITLGTTGLTWTQFTSGTTYTAGNGISISGGVVTAVAAASGGISVVSGGIQLDTTIAVRKYAVTIGDGSTTAFTITHNLGTLDIQVVVREVSTGAKVETDDVAATTNTATVTFATAPTTNQFRVMVQG